MKFCVPFTATALIIATAFDSAMGLAKYLDELPNGNSFTQELGHPDSDSSNYTDFVTAFAAAGHSWATTFCADTLPGSSMAKGAAFGNPCCTWAKGGDPDVTVTAFTTTPGEATVCESGGSSASSTTASPAASGSADAEVPSTDAPSVTTATPSTGTPAVTTTAPSMNSPTEISATVFPYTEALCTADSSSDESDSSSEWMPRPGGCIGYY
ncbi:hypothetical protein BBP00_00004219 [Phytophthora kernoviae]|uniref:Temptin Cys/Cys disulfide domain-containing protein n=1 Tax=Phytophthora kernoviae TaxID=325452 RepID=A0A3F2RSC4_9STRA|nr:hypothetical protein BBP00_00004219 [Phytophthora kernoviae]